MSHKNQQIRDYYKYSDELYRRLIRDYNILSPMQVEFQCGLNCDLYRCPYCYGDGQKQMPSIIYLDTYVKVLDELINLKSKPLIQFAGINTEPTTHPDIDKIVEAVKSRGFICGIHTKGYRLDKNLRNALTNDYEDVESFITISLDSSNSKDYIDVHAIVNNKKDKFKNTSDDYFDTVISNVKNLYKLREEKKSKLKINIAYLLFDENKAEGDINQVVELLGNYSDVIRFSLPQIRNDGTKLNNYIGEDQDEILNELENKFKSNPKVRVLTHTNMISHSTTFKKCYAQYFQAVIDKAGNVFPCPQVPLKNYQWLIYGNVKDSSFMEILDSAKRKQLFDADVDTELKCRICDRKDEAINIKLDKIIY